MRRTGFARCGARLAGLLRWEFLRSREGQRSVALSSTEAEYIAMGEGIKEAHFGVVWICIFQACMQAARTCTRIMSMQSSGLQPSH